MHTFLVIKEVTVPLVKHQNHKVEHIEKIINTNSPHPHTYVLEQECIAYRYVLGFEVNFLIYFLKYLSYYNLVMKYTCISFLITLKEGTSQSHTLRVLERQLAFEEGPA